MPDAEELHAKLVSHSERSTTRSASSHQWLLEAQWDYLSGAVPFATSF